MQGLLNAVAFSFLWLVFIILTVGVGLFALPIYYWLAIHGSLGRAKKADGKLKSALMKDEAVIDRGIQKRIYALASRRKMVAITNSRIILISRSLFGGFSMKDYQWKDLRDAQLSENILPNLCGSKLSFSVNRSQAGIVVDGLPSQVASVIYGHAQSQEQEWEEKNRVRALEEKRAASGGAVVHVGDSAKPAAAGESVFEKLEKAKRLFDSGAISDSEYQELKSKILSSGVL